MSERVALQPVDAADVTIVVDNAIDILAPSTEVAQRPPLVWDWSEREQLRAEHGLVVLSSCSHAGVINVLHHAQRLTGVDKVHGVVGGLHLTGGLFEAIIPRTIDELAAIGPDVVLPGHCTGWKATHLLSARLPDPCLQSNVGTRLHFAASQ
jgi:7,8-dihydropterin-6-yl-methyl-4-(beta-D-ribofuranosyl)aminobenzene 5'-phosphate synthase